MSGKHQAVDAPSTADSMADSMADDVKACPSNLRILTVAVLLGANLFVLVLAAVSLYQSRQQYELRAQLVTRDMVRSVDQRISGSIGHIDLALQAVADELERQLQGGGLDAKAVSGLLERYQQRLPEVEAFRIADAGGRVIFGKGLNPQEHPSWADRDYFILLRDHPEAGLQISRPRQGRVAKQYIIGFARRYNHPDGRFAGVISAPVALEYFQQLLDQFQLGPKGAIILRDQELGLIARSPQVESGPLAMVGNRVVSRELTELAASGVSESTYYTTRAADGLERIASFRRIEGAPMLVVASMASEDFLAGWYADVYKTAAWIIGFALLSIGSGLFSLQLQKQITRASLRNQLYLRHASDGVHILDTQGQVVEASDSFCSMLGYRRAEIIGMNVRQWDARWSARELLETVLPRSLAANSLKTFETRFRKKDGEVIEVEINSICFVMEGRRYIFSSARDIGERKRQQDALEAIALRLQQSEERYRLLLKNSPVGILHYDPNLRVTYANDRFEAIMQVPPGYMLGFDCHNLQSQLLLATLQQTLQGETTHYDGPYVTTYSQRELWISMAGAPLVNESGEILGGIAIFEDITEAKRIEVSERRQRESLIRLNEIAAASHLPLDEQLRQALDIGLKQLGLEFGIVSQVADGIYTIHTQVSPPETLHDGQCFPVAQTCCAITLDENRVVAISEMGKSPYQGHPCYQAFKLEAYIGAPLLVEGRIFGTVSFSSPRPYHRGFDEGDQEFVSLLARWISSDLERDLARRKIVNNEAYLRTIIENEPECVTVISQDGILLQMNRAGMAMIEVDSVEEVNALGLFNWISPEYRQAFKDLTQRVFEGESGILEFRVNGKRGTDRWLESHAAPLRDATGSIIAQLAVIRDVTQLKQHHAQLEYLAHYDPLTRLPNRTLLSDRMHQALAQAGRTGTYVIVGYLDLDGFKAINDSFGHQAGDELLIEMARRLNATVRQGDTVARLGGDEFVLLLVGIKDAAEWQAAAERVLQALAAPVLVQGQAQQISGSLGITLFPEDDTDPDTLLRHADQAMYHAKQAGKNRYQRFDQRLAQEKC